MLGTVVGLLGGVRAAIFAVSAAGLLVAFLWGRWDAADARADAAQLRANVAVLEEVNARTVESFARYRAEQERAQAALVRETERAATRAAELAALIQEAENAPDDRVAGPVLERGFERLRLLDGTAGSRGTPDGEDPAAGRPAVVR